MHLNIAQKSNGDPTQLAANQAQNGAGLPNNSLVLCLPDHVLVVATGVESEAREGPAAASAPAKGGEAKKAAPKEIKPMSTDPKPFKEPTGLDWSGPKQNPIPVMPTNLRPAVLPKNWPAMSNK